MKTNLVPALILAAALLATGYMFNRSSGSAVEKTLVQLETATQTKDAGGKTQLSRILEGMSASAGRSISAGFESGQNEKTKDELAVIEKITLTEIKIVAGSQKTHERVIGVIKNESSATVSDVKFNVMFKDKDGRLMDVSTTFSRLEGSIKPGAELGFEVKRDLGSFSEKEDVLAARKATTAVVAVTDLRLVK